MIRASKGTWIKTGFKKLVFLVSWPVSTDAFSGKDPVFLGYSPLLNQSILGLNTAGTVVSVFSGSGSIYGKRGLSIQKVRDQQVGYPVC